MSRLGQAFAAVVATSLLAGCSTVKIPDLDFFKIPEIREDAVNIKDYPSVADAPTAPTDVRNAAAWDKAAKNLIEAKEDFNAPEDMRAGVTDGQIRSEVEALKDQVRSYKADDPQ